ncbi:general secretion pathway protein GspB [Roseateles paludis]|uniref:General secretion pathway protein GspB n=1 Tax=Roseateles paludis TaxID=3145238 RepID=A0ABV0G2C3_9BURK
MSYILEALRRAEADRERERGQVPGLHAQPLVSAATAPGAGRRRALAWAAGAGLLLLAGWGLGRWWAGEPATSKLPQTPAVTAAPAAAPAPVQPALPVAQLPASAPPPVVAAAPAPSPAATVALPTPPVTAKPAPLAAPQPPAEARIPRLAELPEGLRRELPRLAVSGSVYSDDPAGRFVIINGDVAREGAVLAPQLVLEQIQPRELVLSYKGQRFRQPASSAP